MESRSLGMEEVCDERNVDLKTRRHHNNKGLHQIRTGKTVEQVKRIALKLGVIYARSRNHNI